MYGNSTNIDEAQAIPEIGKILKLMIDTIKGITFIATGSSSFDLQNSTGEPLVGRNLVYQLYPIAQIELSAIQDHPTTVHDPIQIIFPSIFFGALMMARKLTCWN